MRPVKLYLRYMYRLSSSCFAMIHGATDVCETADGRCPLGPKPAFHGLKQTRTALRDISDNTTSQQPP